MAHSRTESSHKAQVRIPSPLLALDNSESNKESTPQSTVRRVNAVPTPTPRLQLSRARASFDLPHHKPKRTLKSPIAFTFKEHFSPVFQRRTDEDFCTFATEVSEKDDPRDSHSTTPKRRVYSYSRGLRATPSMLGDVSPVNDGQRPTTALRRSFESGARVQETEQSTVDLFVGKPAEGCFSPALAQLKTASRHRSAMQLPVMHYYRRLRMRPERGFRTPNTNQRKAASNGGYRTKLQKDPVITKSSLGLYEYADCYEKDEVFMRKMQRCVNLRRRRSRDNGTHR